MNWRQFAPTLSWFRDESVFAASAPAGRCRSTLWLALTLATVLLVLVVRRPEAFQQPQFWAEDGAVFFLQADLVGPAAVFVPYSGYYHLLPRIVALAASAFDPAWTPAIYFWSSIAITLAVAAALFAPRLELPYPPLFALGIVLVPHTGEVFHNLTNVQWITALVLVLLLIARDPHSSRQAAADVGLALVVGLTGIFSLLFAPLFLARAWIRRTPAAAVLALTVLLTAGLQLDALMHHAPPAPAPGGPPEGLIDVIEILVHRIWILLVLPHEVADKLPGWLSGAVAALGTGLLAGTLIRADLRGRIDRLMIWGGAGAITAGVAYKFHDSLVVFTSYANGDRYFVVPKILLLWLILLKCGRSDPLRWLARPAVLAILLASAVDLRFERYHHYDWAAAAAKIRVGEPVKVPINPKGMEFTHPGRSKN